MAIANTTPIPTSVALDLTTLRGERVGSSTGITLPGNGQVAAFCRNSFPAWLCRSKEYSA
jgi:hypothetical protein